MAHTEQININGVLTNVRVFDETAQEIDDAAAKSKWQSNPNLLDNWYFADPVNQRGETSWVNPSNWIYSIDRWQITPSSVVTLADGGITITADFQQALELDRLQFGLTYTFSVLSSDGRLGKHTFNLTNNTSINIGLGFGFFVCYLDGDNAWFRIYGDGSTYKACKLEIGTKQTLAHQDANGNWVLNDPPPNKQQELEKCRKYARWICGGYNGYIDNANNIQLSVPEIRNMRTTPSISNITWDRYVAVSGGEAAYLISSDYQTHLIYNGLRIGNTGLSISKYLPVSIVFEFTAFLSADL